MQYKQRGTYYYFPEVTIENGRLKATFYRNRGQKGVKFTREELHAYWQAKSTVRSMEYQKLIADNNWSRADLARYLGVSRLGNDCYAGVGVNFWDIGIGQVFNNFDCNSAFKSLFSF